MVAVGQPHLGQDPREAQAVQEAEGEDEHDARGPQARRDRVLDADVDDGERDQGLDQARGQAHDPVARERQGEGVGEGEGRHLEKQRGEAGAEEREPGHEEDVIEAERQDVGHAEGEKATQRLPGSRRHGGPGQRERPALGAGGHELHGPRGLARAGDRQAHLGKSQRGEKRDLAGSLRDAPGEPDDEAECTRELLGGAGLPALRQGHLEGRGRAVEPHPYPALQQGPQAADELLAGGGGEGFDFGGEGRGVGGGGDAEGERVHVAADVGHERPVGPQLQAHVREGELVRSHRRGQRAEGGEEYAHRASTADDLGEALKHEWRV